MSGPAIVHHPVPDGHPPCSQPFGSGDPAQEG
jgi:hypothetical protein